MSIDWWLEFLVPSKADTLVSVFVPLLLRSVDVEPWLVTVEVTNSACASVGLCASVCVCVCVCVWVCLRVCVRLLLPRCICAPLSVSLQCKQTKSVLGDSQNPGTRKPTER